METISFQIVNKFSSEMLFLHEPEGFEFRLPPNEEVTIQVDPVEHSITLVHSMEENTCVINILDDKSLYKVLYKGVDVFAQYL